MRLGPFLGLAILLVILWAGGFVLFHVAGFLFHLLLIFAVISLVIQSDAGDLAAVSDEVHLVPALSTTEVAVERVLSI